MGKIEKGYDREEIRKLAKEIKEIHSIISYQFSEILYKTINSPESLTSKNIDRMHDEVDRAFPGDERTPTNLTFDACKIVECLNSMKGVLKKKTIIM